MPLPAPPPSNPSRPRPTPQDSSAFGRDLRLLNGKQFIATFEQKRRAHGACFIVYVAANRLPHARLGLAVSKRVSKKAVQRNRLKRIIRASFRHHQRALGGVDYVVVTKLGAAAQANPALHAELENLWDKARKKCKTI